MLSDWSKHQALLAKMSTFHPTATEPTTKTATVTPKVKPSADKKKSQDQQHQSKRRAASAVPKRTTTTTRVPFK
jgi:hypothetical protein